MKKVTNTFAKTLLLATMGSIIFTACGKSDLASQVSAPAVGNAQGAGGSGGNSPYTGPTTNNQYSDMLPVEQSPEQPLDTPEPLPAPQTPVQPGEVFEIKAVGNTTAFAVPQISKYVQLNGVYVYIPLTWQPVNGAAEYWIYKNDIPEWNEVSREKAFAIVEAKTAQGYNSGLAGYKDGMAAPNLKDGNLWDRVKRGFQTITNRPNVDYVYKIVAVDPNGIPMSQSKVTTGRAMSSVSTPIMLDAAKTSTVTPVLPWRKGTDGMEPHGYYVSVFPSVQGLSQGILPPTSLAAWTTYMNNQYNSVQQVTYGKSKGNLLSYAGVLPFDITFNLKPGANYSWSVISIRTDSGNMQTARQISRTWSGFGHFQISPNAKPVDPRENPEAEAVAAQRVNAQRAYPNYPANTGYNSYNAGTQYSGYPQTSYPQQSSSYNNYGSSYPAQTGYPAQQTGYNNQYGSAYPQQAYGAYPEQRQRY